MSEMGILQLPYVFVPKFGVALNEIGHHHEAPPATVSEAGMTGWDMPHRA